MWHISRGCGLNFSAKEGIFAILKKDADLVQDRTCKHRLVLETRYHLALRDKSCLFFFLAKRGMCVLCSRVRNM